MTATNPAHAEPPSPCASHAFPGPRSHTPNNWEKSATIPQHRADRNLVATDQPDAGVGRSAISCALRGQDAKKSVDFTAPIPELLSQLVSRHGHGPFQPQNNVARQALGNHQPKRFPGLAFYGVSKVRRAPAALEQSAPIETRPHFPSRAYAGRSYRREPPCAPKARPRIPSAGAGETLLKPGSKLRRRDDDDPWRDAHESRHDRHGYACVRESRECACGARPMADKCVS
jgi:hypothetical protein